MRITQNITSGIFINYLNRHTQNLLKTQEQIASQKRINRSSDDPVGMGQVLGYRTALASGEQYQINIEQAMSRLEFNEATLGLASDLVDTARKLAADYSGTALSADMRQSVALQVKDLYDQLMQMANSKFNGNYIFAGHATDQPPFTHVDYAADDYKGDDGDFRVMVSDNVEVGIVADGSKIFQNEDPGGIKIFDELQELIEGLEDPDLQAGSARIKSTISALEAGREQINLKRTEYAPVLYRLRATNDYLTNLRPKVEEAMSKLEQADVTKAAIELKTLELAYETTIATAARIIQPKLLDFLG